MAAPVARLHADGEHAGVALVGHGIQCIERDGQGGLHQLLAVAANRGGPRSWLGVNGDLLATGLGRNQAGQLLRDVVQIDGAQAGYGGPSEAQEALQHAPEAIDLGDVQALHVGLVGGRRQGVLDDLGGAPQGVQGVLDLVGEAGGELAQGSQTLGTDQLAFGLFQVVQRGL